MPLKPRFARPANPSLLPRLWGMVVAKVSGSTPEPGGIVVQLIRGPLTLRANGQLSQRGVVGNTLPLLCCFEDAAGTMLSLSGVALSSTLTLGGTEQDDAVSDAVIYEETSQFRINVTLPTTGGICTLTVDRDGGDGDFQSAQIQIEVKAR